MPPGLLLGSGSFGKVFRGRHRDQVVAVKVIQHDRTMADRVRNEVELMLSFSHPHVLRALDFVTWGRTGVSQMSVAVSRGPGEQGRGLSATRRAVVSHQGRQNSPACGDIASPGM